jgi:hypothetical protein
MRAPGGEGEKGKTGQPQHASTEQGAVRGLEERGVEGVDAEAGTVN